MWWIIAYTIGFCLYVILYAIVHIKKPSIDPLEVTTMGLFWPVIFLLLIGAYIASFRKETK